MKKSLFAILLLSMLNTAFAQDDDGETADPTILLESTFVGDKEQPAVSYFIPWKGNTAPDKLQWNIERKHDETLRIIDRDVLVNSMTIYNEMDLDVSVSTD